MSLENVFTKSQIFNDGPNLLKDIEGFLQEIKKQNSAAQDFSLVHALVFPKDLSDEAKSAFNKNLGATYRHCGYGVLGGDTSSGTELSVFISAIVF